MREIRWNLCDLYEDNKAFLSDFKKAKSLLGELKKYRGKLKNCDKNLLLEYLQKDTEFSIILERLAVYAHCKNDDNGKDKTNIKNYQMINDFFSVVGQTLAFTSPELKELDDEFLQDAQNDPKFKDFDRTIFGIRRDKKHTLTEKEEGMLSAVSSFSVADDTYSVLTDIEMDHGEYVDKNGNKIKLTTGNLNSLMKNPEQSERKKIIETYLDKYRELNLTIASLYLSHIKHTNFLAKAYNFKSALDMSTFGEEVTCDIMKKNIEVVSSKTDLLQRFFGLKKKILGLKEFYTSDINADLFEKSDEKIDFADAAADIKDAFGVLGKDYQKMFEQAAFGGWIDVAPRDAKASGGYTISTYSCHPYILLNYDGTAYWKSAIAHEFGHAMHSYFSAKNQPYAKHDYTIFVAEVASLTNEILLEYHLLEKCKDKKEKMQLLADFLQLFYLNVFNSSMLAEFELFAHGKLDEGVPLTAHELNEYYLRVCKKYFGASVKFVKGYEFDWERRSHFFMDYYLYKYSTGLVCACTVAKNLIDGGEEYLEKYKKFLSLGDSKNPIDSLKVADIDILSDKPYETAFSMFEEFLNELEKLFSEDL